jgi:ADP-ribose pyrophosphatase YjhB (NUDIX family)
MIYISALIQDQAGPTGKVLIGRTKEGVWEFPHDRIRTNESEEEAVSRMAHEVLGLTVKPGKLTMTGHKRPKDGTTEHILCGNITHDTHTKCDYHNYYEAVNLWGGEPKSEAYTQFTWVHPSELGQYTFAGDDASFMAKYDPWIHGGEIPDQRMF